MGASAGGGISVDDGLLDHLDTGIAIFDPEGRLRAANAPAYRYARLQGVDLDDLDLARSLRESPPGFDIDDAPLRVEQSVILAATEGREAQRTVWAGPVDRRRALRKSSHRFTSASTGLEGTVLITRDVSRRAHHDRFPHDFLASTSHELRNPLTPIVGHLELLTEDIERGVPNAAVRLEILRRNVDRIVHRLDELLLLEHLAPRLVVTRCDAARIVEEAVAARASDAAEHEIRILVDVAPAQVSADADRLRMAVEALIGNAVRFGPRGSTVTVALTSDALAGRIDITVIDEGPGFRPSELARVFEPFHRGREARANAVPGLGLGLAVSRAIAHAHGGAIDIVSEPGSGAVVTLTLPVDHR
ncbi:cell wall metabolism sensor histidine kinase WalK [Microbacterium sp. SORGH_AS_0862]|uniref:sensor histidine kinase n=1 Tax=Microbacterium sp. SORGH_AS_0862 TaxID=3041789 RepID=UPI002794E057|nr:PAS domain-containing sensor histidine kinase [Microbacterium sp. SORGH_AS_0862]MDQ1204541.1 signal transduction histidine kinase [Microbacterium sp. SORGH_AS_0862]